MEYKDLIKTAYCCDIKACDDCPSKDRTCCRERAMQELSHALDKEVARSEAAEAAQDTLQRAMADYKARAEKAERERDAAIARIKEDHWCDDCKFNPVSSACRNDGSCEECETPCYCGECVKGSLWEWRGQKEE